MVWHSPAVTRTLINSALVVSAPIFKCFIKSLDGVGRHAAVIARMSKIEACLDAGEDKMRTGRVSLVQPASVERGGRGYLVRTHGCGAQGESARETKSDDAH